MSAKKKIIRLKAIKKKRKPKGQYFMILADDEPETISDCLHVFISIKEAKAHIIEKYIKPDRFIESDDVFEIFEIILREKYDVFYEPVLIKRKV